MVPDLARLVPTPPPGVAAGSGHPPTPHCSLPPPPRASVSPVGADLATQLLPQMGTGAAGFCPGWTPVMGRKAELAKKKKRKYKKTPKFRVGGGAALHSPPLPLWVGAGCDRVPAFPRGSCLIPDVSPSQAAGRTAAPAAPWRWGVPWLAPPGLPSGFLSVPDVKVWGVQKKIQGFKPFLLVAMGCSGALEVPAPQLGAWGGKSPVAED